jgi:hypothetical protein
LFTPGKKQRYGADRGGVQGDIEGTTGEYTLCKITGERWGGEYGEADVGPWQVRSTSHPYGRLLVHRPIENGRPGDHPDQKFVFVLLDRLPKVEINGWFYGREAQQGKYWLEKDGAGKLLRNAAYFVPREFLHGMDTFWDR